MIEFNLFDERLKEMLKNLNVALVHVANKISEGKLKIVVKDKKFYAGNNGVLYLEDVKRAQMSIEDYENNKEINYGKWINETCWYCRNRRCFHNS